MHTHDTRGRNRTARNHPEGTVAGESSSGSLFVVAIPYRDIFMTDIFSDDDVDGGDPVAIPRLPQPYKPRKKSRPGWMPRCKQELAGSDYL